MREDTAMHLECIERIKKLMNWDDAKASLWMMTENPMLGGVTPNYFFLVGRGHKVVNFIKAAEEENKPNEGN
jgi:hypothetical protein